MIHKRDVLQWFRKIKPPWKFARMIHRGTRFRWALPNVVTNFFQKNDLLNVQRGHVTNTQSDRTNRTQRSRISKINKGDTTHHPWVAVSSPWSSGSWSPRGVARAWWEACPRPSLCRTCPFNPYLPCLASPLRVVNHPRSVCVCFFSFYRCQWPESCILRLTSERRRLLLREVMAVDSLARALDRQVL